jgi:hypothetical protein
MNTATKVRDPLIYEFPTAEEEADYNAWLNEVAAASRANPHPATPHELVATEIRRFLVEP